MLLFCIPHAGGIAMSYLRWRKELMPEIRLMPIELQGHMTRRNEPLSIQFSEAVDDIYKTILNTVGKTGEKYAIFGHSLGCWLAYDVGLKLEKDGEYLPQHYFLSGRWPPYVKQETSFNFTDDSDKFRKYIISLGGTDESFLENDELGEYYFKTICADFKLINSYKVKEIQSSCLHSNVTVLWGSQDNSIVPSSILQWRKVAKKQISFCPVEGNHFFPLQNISQTVRVINSFLG